MLKILGTYKPNSILFINKIQTKLFKILKSDTILKTKKNHKLIREFQIIRLDLQTKIYQDQLIYLRNWMTITFIYKNKIHPKTINMVIWWYCQVYLLYKILTIKIKSTTPKFPANSKDIDNKTVRTWGTQIILKLQIIKWNKQLIKHLCNNNKMDNAKKKLTVQ